MVTKIIKKETSVHPPQPIRGSKEQSSPGRKTVVGYLECFHLVESLPVPCMVFIVCLARGRSSGTWTKKKKKKKKWGGGFSKDTATHGNG